MYPGPQIKPVKQASIKCHATHAHVLLINDQTANRRRAPLHQPLSHAIHSVERQRWWSQRRQDETSCP